MTGMGPPAPEQKSMMVQSAVVMSGMEARMSRMAAAASSAGLWRWMKGSLLVHCAVRVFWQQCLSTGGMLWDTSVRHGHGLEMRVFLPTSVCSLARV